MPRNDDDTAERVVAAIHEVQRTRYGMEPRADSHLTRAFARGDADPEYRSVGDVAQERREEAVDRAGVTQLRTRRRTLALDAPPQLEAGRQAPCAARSEPGQALQLRRATAAPGGQSPLAGQHGLQGLGQAARSSDHLTDELGGR